MARPRLLDHMQSYAFWLADVSPSLQPPFFAFHPKLGFSSISMPEVSIDIDEIVDGNYRWKRKAAGKASAGEVTLSRGALFYVDDFWQWISDTIYGNTKPRRTLLLVQYLGASADEYDFLESFGPPEGDEARRIPGRAWLLKRCLPTRYVPGGELNALTPDVSIMEIGVQPEEIAEIALGTVAGAFISAGS